MFEEFLQLLGEKVKLRGFDKYKGGLGKRKFIRVEEPCVIHPLSPRRYRSRLNGTVLCLHKLAKY
jgi:Rap/ran-GAP